MKIGYWRYAYGSLEERQTAMGVGEWGLESGGWRMEVGDKNHGLKLMPGKKQPVSRIVLFSVAIFIS